jgi:hypothetical protein
MTGPCDRRLHDSNSFCSHDGCSSCRTHDEFGQPNDDDRLDTSVVSTMRHRKTRGSGVPIDQLETRKKLARVRLGSYEFKKKGISRFDLRDPYHLAIALTWPQFLVSLLVLYLFMNVVL